MELKEIFDLIDKFDESGLSEIRYKQNEESITLKKGHEPHIIHGGMMSAMPAPMPAAASSAQGFPSVNTDARESVSTAPSTEGAETITAPIVGTFYRSPAPDSPPFVEEGSQVKAGSTLCILEAMKVMNELEADYDLEIVKILVEAGSMVEYGSPLFEVKRI
jgi:acetyl-CoA carboxylase biotin carboxyl carrier protein